MIKNLITNIIVPIIAIGGVGMAIYSSMMLDQEVRENMRIADSLHAEVEKYHCQYDSLLTVANDMDKKIDEQGSKIDSLRKRPPVIIKPNPPITNGDEAVSFLKDFIKE